MTNRKIVYEIEDGVESLQNQGLSPFEISIFIYRLLDSEGIDIYAMFEILKEYKLIDKGDLCEIQKNH